MFEAMEPVAYDPETRKVALKDGTCAGWHFINKAVQAYARYGEQALLSWAVREGMPEVLENEHAQEILARLIEGEPIRRRGQRPTSREQDSQKDKTLKAIWFFIGQGYPAYINPESEAKGEDACGLAARQFGLSHKSAYRLWINAGGHSPTGTTAITAHFHITRGKNSVTTK